MTRVWAAALAGVVAAGLGLGVGETVAAMTRPEAAPLAVVGTRFIQLTPHWLQRFAIDLFGTHDKDALRVGVAVVVVLLAATAGWRATRRLGEGLAIVGLFGAAAVYCALTINAHRASDVWPSIVATIAAGLLLSALTTRLHGWTDTEDPARSADDRRRFLTLAGAGAGLAVLAGFGGRYAQHDRFDAARSRAKVVLPPAADSSPSGGSDSGAASGSSSSSPAGADLGRSPIPFRTTNADFYRIDTAYTIPQIDAQTWTLKIHGMVDHPRYYTFAELLAMPLVERWITMACVSNEVGGDLIGNAQFRGVLLAPLLEAAGVKAGADQLVSRSRDGMTIGTPVAAVLDGRDAMLAVGMNGQPLPVAHGFPVRMVVPGLYGYVSACKWITDIEVTTFDAYDAYWVTRGWVAQLPVQLSSRIDTPKAGAGGLRRGQQVDISGVAWHQHVGISRVEVQIDNGDWTPARLGTVPSLDTWVQWTLPWTPDSVGLHRISVRAVDAKGQAQDTRSSEPYPGASSGLHRISVRVS